MKQVIIHDLARAEMDRAISFYEERKAGLGLDLLTEIERVIVNIRINPHLGAHYKKTGLRYYLLR